MLFITGVYIAFGASPLISETSIMLQGDRSTSNRTYNNFMCPGMASVGGHLLTFAEGRRWTCADFGAHDLVMRRSVDDGKTWEPLRTVLDPNSLGGCNTTEACLWVEN